MYESVTFAALDGRTLHGTLYGAAQDAHTALLINSGTGIPQRFYRRFCEFAAARGFLVLSYDYRGIGASASSPLRHSTAVYRDWGQLDLPGAVDFLQCRGPGLPLVTVGHSTGGQQLGLSDRVTRIRAALFVAVSTGYWRGMPRLMGALNLALWHLFAPACGLLLGYFPGRVFGLGENLPMGVAREWGDWCLQPDYLAAYFDDTGRRRPRDGRSFGAQHFSEARFAIRSINFHDDGIATAENVPPLLSLYTGASVDIRWYRPADYGVDAVGHLGFFRRGHEEHWRHHLEWLQEQAQKEPSQLR
ncbi:MAG: serine aminopeptidase domain-containing protein [Nannocystaceae bacterium]